MMTPLQVPRAKASINARERDEMMRLMRRGGILYKARRKGGQGHVARSKSPPNASIPTSSGLFLPPALCRDSGPPYPRWEERERAGWMPGLGGEVKCQKVRCLLLCPKPESHVWPPSTREGGLGCRRKVRRQKHRMPRPGRGRRREPARPPEGRKGKNPTLLTPD